MIPEAAVAFVADLLRAPDESKARTVGGWLWPVMGDGSLDDLLVELTELIRIHGHTEGPQSRIAELAVEVWLLLGLRGVAADTGPDTRLGAMA